MAPSFILSSRQLNTLLLLKNKIQVERKNSSDSIFVFMGLFISTQMLVVFNSSKRKLIPNPSIYVYISNIHIYFNWM